MTQDGEESRPGGVGRGGGDHPTSEYPEYAKGQATAEPPRPWTDPDGADSGEVADPVDRPGLAPAQQRSGGRGLFWLGGVVVVVLLLVFGARSIDIWPSWRNPFVQEETDRSGPPLLQSIQDLSRYVAAEGNFQVVIDLQQDRRYVPDFLLNERTLFVGVGSVEAYVDFAKIAENAVVESADGKSVEIILPAPQLGETNLNLSASYVFAEERGLLNRIGDVFGGDPNRQREVYQLAEERIGAAARDSGLAARAQENTQKMLEGLLRSLGYQTVKITYAAP